MASINALRRSVYSATHGGNLSETVVPNLLATSEAAVRTVCEGVFPWESGPTGANGLITAQHHFGLLYRTARHKLARTREEEALLAKEVVLMHNWLEERLAGVAEKREHLQRQLAACTAQCATVVAAAPDSRPAHEAIVLEAAQQSRSAGRMLLLEQEEERLRCMQADARRRVPLDPPAPPVEGVPPGGAVRGAQAGWSG